MAAPKTSCTTLAYWRSLRRHRRGGARPSVASQAARGMPPPAPPVMAEPPAPPLVVDDDAPPLAFGPETSAVQPRLVSKLQRAPQVSERRSTMLGSDQRAADVFTPAPTLQSREVSSISCPCHSGRPHVVWSRPAKSTSTAGNATPAAASAPIPSLS